MLKKRLIGVITVLQGQAVQSFGYRRYLPMGKPEVLVENLDRWGADEIVVQCIDRSAQGLGPDFGLLRRIGALGLSTPLTYGGGLRNADDAVMAVRYGADRVVVDAMVWDAPAQMEALARELGAQALIANLPVRVEGIRLCWLNYRNGRERYLDETGAQELGLEWISEVMLTDWQHEGIAGSFDPKVISAFPWRDRSLIVFGGLSRSDQIQNVLAMPNVMAAAVGNFLSYREHAVQKIKRDMFNVPVRSARFVDVDGIHE